MKGESEQLSQREKKKKKRILYSTFQLQNNEALTQRPDFNHTLKFPKSVKTKIMGFQNVLNQPHT